MIKHLPTLYDWSALRVKLVWIYQAPPVVAHGERTQNNLTGWYIRQGSVSLKQHDQEITAQAGEWLFLPKGISTRHFSPDAEILSLNFYAVWPDGTPLFEQDHPIIVKDENYPDLRVVAEPLLRLVQDNYPEAMNHLPEQSASLNEWIGNRFSRF